MILNVSWVELEKVHVTFTNASLYIWNLLMWRFVKSHVMIYLCRIILHCVGFPTQLNISCDVFQSSHEDAVTFTNMPLHFQSLQYTISNVTWDDGVFLAKHLMWWFFFYVTICDHHMRWSWSCDVIGTPVLVSLSPAVSCTFIVARWWENSFFFREQWTRNRR